MAKLVSKTYGDALFEVALEKNQLDEFLDEVKAAQTAIEENKELFKLMSHPKIVKEEKIKIITDIFTGKVSEELVGLLRMIVDKGHFEQVDSVFTYFIDEVKDTHININTFYTNEKGECIGKYNITLRRKGTRQVINFDYLLDATDKNIKLLVAECIRLYVKGERLQNAYA